MKKILIFYASYGGGHLSAAKSIESVINSEYPNIETKLIDCMKYVNKGVEKITTVEKDCPIIKVEDIYANEYYQANQSGFQPSLRLKISRLNYEDEPELIYMNKTYTIIRTQETSVDELVLICERKVKNV